MRPWLELELVCISSIPLSSLLLMKATYNVALRGLFKFPHKGKRKTFLVEQMVATNTFPCPPLRADKTTCQIFLSSLTGRQKLFCWLRCQFCSSSPVFWLRCIHGHVGVSSSHWFRIWDDSNNGAFFTSISFNKFVMNLFTKFGLKVWKIRWLLRLCPKPHWWSPELSQNALKTWYSSKWR